MYSITHTFLSTAISAFVKKKHESGSQIKIPLALPSGIDHRSTVHQWIAYTTGLRCAHEVSDVDK